jgi:hypothetical protein
MSESAAAVLQSEDEPKAEEEATPQLDEHDDSEVPSEQRVAAPGIGRFGLQVESSNSWRMNATQKTLPAQCLEQDYWQHVAAQLRPGDEILVMPDDLAWKLRLHVIDAGHNWAHVAQESFSKFKTRADMTQVPSIYRIEFAGTTDKWRVLRKDKLLKKGFTTESLARQWAANHQAATKR